MLSNTALWFRHLISKPHYGIAFGTASNSDPTLSRSYESLISVSRYVKKTFEPL